MKYLDIDVHHGAGSSIQYTRLFALLLQLSLKAFPTFSGISMIPVTDLWLLWWASLILYLKFLSNKISFLWLKKRNIKTSIQLQFNSYWSAHFCSSCLKQIAKVLRPVVLGIILCASHGRTFSLIHGYSAPLEIYKHLEHHEESGNSKNWFLFYIWLLI